MKNASQVQSLLANIVGVNNMEPTKENRNLEHIKVAEIGESVTLRRNAARVEPDLLEYVKRQMRRETATCEVIGQAILFQEEMHTEMSIIEEHLLSKGGFEQEEAFWSRW